MRDVLGVRKKWDPNKKYWTRNAWHHPKDVDQPGHSVTSGYMQGGAEQIGDFGPEHIYDSVDRGLLQGFGTEPVWPASTPELSLIHI